MDIFRNESHLVHGTVRHGFLSGEDARHVKNMITWG